MPECNYFKDLELELTATSDDVRTAYKRLAKLWHPDKNNEAGAEEKFKQILAAYTHLQSDDRRETHAREIKRQREATVAPKSKPPPQPPPPHHASAKPKPSEPPPSTPKNSQDSARPKSSKSRNSQSGAGTTQQQYSWDSFKKKNSSSQKPPTSNASSSNPRPRRAQSRARMFNMHSFMNFDDDPFNDFIFDIFMVAPERPQPKQKPKTDLFGNKLPKNLDGNLYDWKTATKNPGAMPDYQEYLDNETEFSCHYCGQLMDMEMLRKHEPRCRRLGGKKKAPTYEFAEEEVNAAYAGSSPSSPTRPKSSSVRKIKCKWCGESFSKTVAADHILQCQEENGNYTYTPRARKPKPEWDNNFTDTQYDDQDYLYRDRPRSSRIDLDDFNPFSGVKPKACLSCKVKYGLTAPQYCNH